MERYFQRRVEPGPEATAVAQSMESEGADDHDTAMAQSEEDDDRDGCARAVVRAPEIGGQPYQPRRASFPKVSFGRSSITVSAMSKTVDMAETCACERSSRSYIN